MAVGTDPDTLAGKILLFIDRNIEHIISPDSVIFCGRIVGIGSE